MKLNGISEFAVQRIVPLSDARFPVVYRASADSQFRAHFGLLHAVHIAVQYGRRFTAEKFLIYRIALGQNDTLMVRMLRMFKEEDFLLYVVIIFDANILRVIAERFPE